MPPAGHELARLEEDPGFDIQQARFYATGQRLVTIRWVTDNDPAQFLTRVWDIETGEVLLDRPGDAAELAIDPSGRHVATSRGLDAVVDVWNIETGETVVSMRTPARSCRRSTSALTVPRSRRRPPADRPYLGAVGRGAGDAGRDPLDALADRG